MLVEKYLDDTLEKIINKYHVGKSTLKDWSKLVECNVSKLLKQTHEHNFSFSFKFQAIKYYLTNQSSKKEQL